MKILRILILTLAASFSFFAAFAKANMFGGAILIFLNSLSFNSIHLLQNSSLTLVLDVMDTFAFVYGILSRPHSFDASFVLTKATYL